MQDSPRKEQYCFFFCGATKVFKKEKKGPVESKY